VEHFERLLSLISPEMKKHLNIPPAMFFYVILTVTAAGSCGFLRPTFFIANAT
jgi:hypothetical protein